MFNRKYVIEMLFKSRKGIAQSQDFVKALKRVAVVVPIWMAFRTIIRGVTETISQGVKYWVELESAIARASAVTRTAGMETGKAMDILRLKAEKYAKVNAGTAKEVVEAYYRMATSGLNFTEAISASIPATKLAKATYGEVATTAKTVSAMYRLLGDTIEGATTESQKMNKITNILALAWSNNEVEIGELSQAIANFGGQAKRFNLTFTETIALLATSHQGLIKAGSAGRLVTRVFQDMSQHLDKVGKFLGKTFDPQQQVDWFKLLMEIVGKFREMGKATPQIVKDMSGMFGIRAQKELGVLVTLFDDLDKNMKIFSGDVDKAVDNLLEIRNNTPEVQLENMRDNMNVLIEEFIMGITKTDDFVDGLKEINKVLDEMSLNASVAGTMIRTIWDNINILKKTIGKGIENPMEAFNFAIDLGAELGGQQANNPIINELVKTKDVGDEITKAIEEYYDRRNKLVEEQAKKEKELHDKTKGELKEQFDSTYKISLETQRKLNLAKDSLKYLEMELSGVSKVQIEYKKLTDYVDNWADTIEDTEKHVDRQAVVTAILAQNWNKVAELTKTYSDDSKELVKVQELLVSYEKAKLNLTSEANDVAQTLIDHQIELMEIRGATKRQQLETRIELEKELGNTNSLVDKLNRQLELEREITKEKTHQTSLSSRTLKLYEIAQKYGINVAKQIADVLGGTTSLEKFTGSKSFGTQQAQAVFQKEFADIWKNFQAGQFFFKGAGTKIPIPERDLSKEMTEVPHQKELERIVKPIIPIDVKSVINMSLDSGDIAKRIINKIKDQLDDDASEIAKKIDERIEKY